MRRQGKNNFTCFTGIGRSILYRRLREYETENFSRSALVFAPHQDDETLGCGGTIVRKLAAGAEVGLVFLSDGGTSHEKLMAPELMAEKREQEAREAGRVLGIESQDIEFFRYPNRRVREHFAEAVSRVEYILAEREPLEIFIPCRREPPADHVATRDIVLSAVQRRAKPVAIFEYPIWFWEHFPWMPAAVYAPRTRRAYLKHSLRSLVALLRDFRCGVYIADVRDTKFNALNEHKSQMTRLQDSPKWSTLGDIGGGRFLACFFNNYEIFHNYMLSEF